jgi:hypothetical protein
MSPADFESCRSLNGELTFRVLKAACRIAVAAISPGQREDQPTQAAWQG